MDDEEEIFGYMILGDSDEVPADQVLWNMTGEEIIFHLATDMVPENRYQLLVRSVEEGE